MNSLQDLNAWGNTAVEFGNQADYAIVVNNLGSTAFTRAEEDIFLVPKRIQLTTYTDAYTDLLVTITTSRAESVQDIFYNGNDARIQLIRQSPTNWQVFGIRSTDRYNDLFNNLFCQLELDQAETFALIVLVNDQIDSNNSYNMNITVTDTPEFSIPTSIVYNEDESVVLQPISVLDTADQQYSVTIATPGPSVGLISIDGIAQVSHTLTGTRQQINSVFAANSVIFEPFADFDVNTTILYTQIRTTDGAVHADALPIAMLIGNTHEDFSAVEHTWSVFDLDRTVNATYQITDLAVAKQYQITLATSVSTDPRQPGQQVDAVRLAGNRRNAVVFQDLEQLSLTLPAVLGDGSPGDGSKQAINEIFDTGNILFRPNNYYYGRSRLFYTQLQTTDNLVQAVGGGSGSQVRTNIYMAANPPFYFADTVFKGGLTQTFPVLHWDPLSNDEFLIKIAAEEFASNPFGTPPITFTHQGSTSTTLEFTGTQTQLSTLISQVVINELRGQVFVGVTNLTQNRFVGWQNFGFQGLEDLPEINPNFRFGSSSVLRPLTNSPFASGDPSFYCGLTAGFERNNGVLLYPAFTPLRILESNLQPNNSRPAFVNNWSLTFGVQGDNLQQDPARYRFRDSDGNMQTAATVTFTGTAAEINEKIHWNNLQTRRIAGSNVPNFFLQNIDPSVEFPRSASGAGGTSTSGEFVSGVPSNSAISELQDRVNNCVVRL